MSKNATKHAICEKSHFVSAAQMVRLSDLIANMLRIIRGRPRNAGRTRLQPPDLQSYHARVQVHCPAERRAEWSDKLHTVMQPTSGIDSRCTSKRADGVCLLPPSMQLPENH